MKSKVLARHKWVTDCTITESVCDDERYRKFTATILGWRGFYLGTIPTEKVTIAVSVIREKVQYIKDKIKAGNNEVYSENNVIYPELKSKLKVKDGDPC